MIEEPEFENSFEDETFQHSEPMAKGKYTMIGNKNERVGLWHKLDRIHNHTNYNIEGNNYQGIERGLLFSLFELTYIQQSQLIFMYNKLVHKYSGKRPTLFAALLYWLGIPILDIEEKMLMDYGASKYNMLRLFNQTNLKRKKKNDRFYWLRRYMSLFDINDEDRAILKKVIKIKPKYNPRYCAVACLYFALARHGITQKQLAEKCNLQMSAIVSNFAYIKKKIGLNKFYQGRNITDFLEKYMSDENENKI